MEVEVLDQTELWIVTFLLSCGTKERNMLVSILLMLLDNS